MRHLFVILWLICVLLTIRAQDNPDHILVEPSALDYIPLLPELLDQEWESYSDQSALMELVNREIQMRYQMEDWANIPFDILITLEPERFSGINSSLSEPDWHQLLLMAWLKLTRPNLETKTTWQFDDYLLNVQPVDFTGDGINELVIELFYKKVDDFSEFIEYFVLQHDTSTAGGYSRFGDTGFWFSTRCPLQLSCGGAGEILDVVDVNGDDLPDWILSRGSCSYGNCSIWMQIYSFQEGEFRDLFDTSRPSVRVVSGGGGVASSPKEGIWNFENSDSDLATELIQIQIIEDNRDCHFALETQFDWSDSYAEFIEVISPIQYERSPMCELRLAHDAMKALEFEQAIIHYENMLNDTPPDDIEDVWHYAELRLATAYALTGQVQHAIDVLANINITAIHDEIIREMAQSAKVAFSEDQNPIQLCASIYHTLAGFGYWTIGSSRILALYGQNNDFHVSLNYGGGDLSPANAGCNILELWQQDVYELSNLEPLDAQLEQLRWEVGHSYQTDLNHDGIDEWFIIPEALPLRAVLRWSSEVSIHHTSLTLSSQMTSMTYSEITMIPLPYEHSDGLAVLQYGDESSCQTDGTVQVGSVKAWRLENLSPIQIATSELCQPQTIAEIFPNPNERHTIQADGTIRIAYWDETEIRYLVPIPETVSTENPEIPAYECDFNTIYELCGDLSNPAEALVLIDLVLAHPPENVPENFLPAFHYLRALTSEQLNRHDEALTEYLNIYNKNPSSIYAQLAELHFQSIEEK